jgi:hypothetical protein
LDSVKRLAALIILLSVHFPLVSAEANAILQKTTTFAMGGIGYAGTMSQGERALREVLAHSDAVARLESALPEASPAGQLYALLGLRTRDRDAYKRAFGKYGQRHATVETMSGCIVQRESFRDLAKKIDHGDYDSTLTRPGSAPDR